MINKLNLFFILIFFILFHSGCNKSDIEKATPVKPASLNIIKYLKDPETVILKVQVTPENLSVQNAVFSPVNEFCLYGDNRVIYKSESGLSKDIYPLMIIEQAVENIKSVNKKEEILSWPLSVPKMMTVTLEDDEVQELLNFVIEENKFFNIEKKDISDENKTLISIKVNIIKRYKSLTFTSEGPEEFLDLYWKLKKFYSFRAKNYMPQKISLSVYRVPDFMDNYYKYNRKATEWPFNEMDLLTLSTEYEPKNVGGSGIGKIFDFFATYPPNDFFYFYNNKVYGIYYRPYLPDEILD